MGCGGIVKTAFRVIVPVVVAMIPGAQPFAIALAAAGATAATGGSFKESLMAGATSYIGSSISASIGEASKLQGEALDAAFAAGDEAYASAISSGLSPSAAAAVEQAAYDKAFKAAGGNFFTEVAGTASDFLQPLTDAGTELSENIGNFIAPDGSKVSNAFEEFRRLSNQGLDALGFKGTATTPIPFNAAGTAAGTAFTLQAALMTDEYDELLLQRYTPEQIALLKNEARNAMSQKVFERLQGEGINPGLDQGEFDSILARGIDRQNLALGQNITQQQFDDVFNLPDIGQTFLDQESTIRRSGFNNDINNTFTGNAFGDIDQDIISGIVEERAGPARKQISNYGARGNFNATGGQKANDFLNEKVSDASNKVEGIGRSILGQGQQEINAIGDSARGAAGGYKLGDELFDIAPFSDQRSNLIEERQGTLGSDIDTALGSDPLFNVSDALLAGGRAQGQVSGASSNQGLLDTLAAREGAGASKTSRGLGTRGSGTF
jgi:hypothetical protein